MCYLTVTCLLRGSEGNWGSGSEVRATTLWKPQSSQRALRRQADSCLVFVFFVLIVVKKVFMVVCDLRIRCDQSITRWILLVDFRDFLWLILKRIEWPQKGTKKHKKEVVWLADSSLTFRVCIEKIRKRAGRYAPRACGGLLFDLSRIAPSYRLAET